MKAVKGTQSGKVIVWAVDPTRKIGKDEPIIQELKIWSQKLNCAVQPMAVVSGSKLAGGVQTEDQISDYLAKILPKEFLLPEVLVAPTLSNRQMAAFLARSLSAKGTVMVFANTRAKKTWNPFRLGGFAETLISTAKVPVLLMNPLAKPSAKISSMLFATDFSKESKQALSELQPLAKSFDAEVTVFNQLDWPTYYFAEMGGAWPAPNLAPLAKEAEENRQKKVLRWAADLEKHGVSASGVLRKQRKTLAEDISEEARKNNSGLIVMHSQGGRAAHAILGSVVRDVVVQAPCAVLVFHKSSTDKKTTTPRRNKLNSVPKIKNQAALTLHS